MLTRLQVSGFKNLENIDIRFGPFTCIAGPNGSGKSNLFDVITFISELANDTLMNAAMHVRDEHGKTSNIRNIFQRVGDKYADIITIKAEMIIPKQGFDDLGQLAEASSTFVTYEISLKYHGTDFSPSASLGINSEKLDYFTVNDAHNHLKFPYNASQWRSGVIINKRRAKPYITTDIDSGNVVINLRQDGSHGRSRSFLAKNLPRTIISTVNATESPTALLARREMQSWRLLQLEPSSLREPDDFSTTPGIAATGAHLPITLYNLTKQQNSHDSSGVHESSNVYDQISFSLNRLIDDIRSVRVERDTKRELYTIEVSDKYGTFYPARSLSDGTLRFLALATLRYDPKSTGLICLEEPENGIHPERIRAMIDLLSDLSVDTDIPVSADNPLRQVIINTHSPAVVSLIKESDLLVSHLKETTKQTITYKTAAFSWLSKTWRAEANPEIRPIAVGKLISYLNPYQVEDYILNQEKKAMTKRVKDRPELQMMFPFVRD